MGALRSSRPPRTYTTDPVTRGIRRAALAGVAMIALWVAFSYPSMPAMDPTHVNSAGEGDATGDRSGILVMTAVMGGLAVLLAWLSTKPRSLNYVTDITVENAQFVYREGERMLVWMMVPLVALYLGFVLETVGHAGTAVIVLSLVALAVVTPVSLVRMSAASAKRPDIEGAEPLN